jgi:hypothetical protein
MREPPVEARSPTRIAAWLAAAVAMVLAAAALARAGVPRLLGTAGEGPPAVAPGAGAPPAAAEARPQGAGPAAAPAPGPLSRDEPLYAGRQPAWWSDRLRAIERLPGPDQQRLRALTLRRAAGVGLRLPGGEAGTSPGAAPAPAAEGR